MSGGPATEAFANQYKDKAFQALGLDIWDYTSFQVANFRNQTGITYPLLLKGGVMKPHYAVPYNTGYVVVGPDGIIRYTVTKNSTYFPQADVKRVVDSLLSAMGPTALEKKPSTLSQQPHLRAFPQPFRSGAKLTLLTPGTQNQIQKVEVIDFLGRVRASSRSSEIPGLVLFPGEYVVRAKTQGKVLFRKLTILQ